MAHDISVIISTRDNPEGLVRLVRSLDQQTFSSDRYEIIVADDSNGIETSEAISGLATDAHKFVVRSEGQGFVYGRNKCFKTADSNLLLYLNDTCIAPATLLEEHYKAHVKYPHAVVRGPLMPLRGDLISELKPFKAPVLDFTIINSSIPKLGIAQLESFNEQCPERFQNNEMYWRLLRSNFKTNFVTSCYCFQNYLSYQEHSLATIRSRADRLAASAADYYLSKPGKDTLEFLQLDIKLNFIQQLMAANSIGNSIASSLLGGKLEGKGSIQSMVIDAVFYYTFYEKLRNKLKNFS